MKVFNLQGYARNLISDQGSELCEKLMQEVVRLLKIKHHFSTSHHPASHGNIESYNRTLKIMLKSIADKHLYSCDEHIDYALFCYQEVKVHGLGFLPFELTFGENRHGPLSLLKEQMVPNSSRQLPVHVFNYMQDLRDKIQECKELEDINSHDARYR